MSAEDVREALQSLRYVHDKLLTRHISRDTALAVDIREVVDCLEARLQEADDHAEALAGAASSRWMARAKTAEARLARLERANEAATRELARASDVRTSRIGIIGNAMLILQDALAATEEGAER